MYLEVAAPLAAAAETAAAARTLTSEPLFPPEIVRLLLQRSMKGALLHTSSALAAEKRREIARRMTRPISDFLGIFRWSELPFMASQPVCTHPFMPRS